MIDPRITNKTVRVLAGAFLFALLTSLALHSLLARQLLDLQKKDTALQDKIAALALTLRETDLARKKEEEVTLFFDKVARYQNKTQMFFQALAKESVKPVCFTSLTRSKNKMEWQGYALSNAALLSYLKSLMSAKHFSELTIESLQQEVMQEKVRFKLRAVELEGLSLAENEGESK